MCVTGEDSSSGACWLPMDAQFENCVPFPQGGGDLYRERDCPSLPRPDLAGILFPDPRVTVAFGQLGWNR